MEIKVGHVYLTRKGELFQSCSLAANREPYVWKGTFFSKQGSLISDILLISSELTYEIDSSIWDKAIKLHEVYITALKTLMESAKSDKMHEMDS